MMSDSSKGDTCMASDHDNVSMTITEARTDPPKTLPVHGPPKPAEARPPSHRWRKWLVWAGLVAGLAVGGYYLKPTVETMLYTISTDDAYVNGHVTFVAPRVAGQVSRVLVDDNMHVKRRDVVVELDRTASIEVLCRPAEQGPQRDVRQSEGGLPAWQARMTRFRRR